MSGFRLSHGGDAIDRGCPVTFRFDGKTYRGFKGDTLASALIANGVWLVGRSFKYHRPRGVYGTGFAEPNALVALGEGARRTPNLPATQIALEDGLVAASINAWPTLRFDIGRVNDLASRLLPPGFYYKTFMWPGWQWFEPFIRRAAGIGRAPHLPDPDRYDAVERQCDVMVVGGGAAGMAAARAASEAGAKVVLVEAASRLGLGMALASGSTIDGLSPTQWRDTCEAALNSHPNVTILRRTTALGYYDHNFVTGVQEIDSKTLRQRLWKMRAREVVLATGAFERPLLFANNDRPGVMLAGAFHDYLAHYGAAAGKAPLFATNHDSAYAAAFAAQDAGLDVRGIVDSRAFSAHAATARARGIKIHTEACIEQALGMDRIRAASIRTAEGIVEIACDTIAVSGGWMPAAQLFIQSGGQSRHSRESGAFVPGEAAQATHVCGSITGEQDLSLIVADGARTGREAANGHRAGRSAPMRMTGGKAPAVVEARGDGKTVFVDLQTDVTAADLELAVRENYRAPDHAKRYTVWGMGTDQGKLSTANGAALLARYQGLPPDALGPTKSRPPFAPVAMGAISAGRARGRLYRPYKRLPAHRWHDRHGAEFEDFGYLRPSHYPLAGEDIAEASQREAQAVRNGVGLLDGSTFGKFELKGPDAAAFLDRICAFRASRLEPGRIGYTLLLDEFGTMLDDGVIARLAPDHFLFTASSGHADFILRWLERWLQDWRLDLVLRDVSWQWAVLTVAGPKARALLKSAGCSIALDGFAHHSIREGEMAGGTVRIQRVSFTGEPSYEIAMPCAHAEAMAEHLWECGQAFGLVPFGLDALDILRLEKGYLYIGSDTDSTCLPADIGWTSPAKRSDDFLGRQALHHESAGRSGRLQSVGLMSVERDRVLPIGAHIIGGRQGASQGFVTSACFSPTLGRALALALLNDGHARQGETVRVWSEGREWPATVTSPRFFDPKGERLNG